LWHLAWVSGLLEVVFFASSKQHKIIALDLLDFPFGFALIVYTIGAVMIVHLQQRFHFLIIISS
jgi:hypothetical protein